MSRIGVDGFEQLVPEAIPRAGIILVLVPATEEKDQFAAQFVLEGLGTGEPAILLESDAGIRDLLRRLGNMGFDAEKAVADGRVIPVDWARVASAKNGAPGGLPGVESALATAGAAAKPRGHPRFVVDLSATLPESLGSVSLDDLARRFAEIGRGLEALSLVLTPRAHGLAPAIVESFDLALDLRPLKPSGIGLAVVAIGGTPLPRSLMNLTTADGRLVLEPAKRAVAVAAASVECPVCKSIIPAGALECPVCKSPRPLRRQGETEVLDYIEALGQRVGPAGVPLEPAAPAPPAPPSPEAPTGKEGAPVRREPARRGLTNGLVKRRKMAVPAAPQGRVNGLTSMITATRRGMTNGLTNGNGFTNGLGAKRFVSEARQRVWRVYLIPILAVSLLAVPLFFSPEIVTVNTFGIDGSFTEWTNLASLPTDLALPGAIDLVSVGVRTDSDHLFGYIETRAPLLQGSPNGSETDALRMFVDTDSNANTGYAADGVGAEELVEIAGSRGEVVRATAYMRPPGADPSDWNAWASADGVLAAVGRGEQANRIEFSVPRPPGARLRALFESLSYDRREDTSGFALSPDRGTLVVEQRSVAPMNLNGTADLLELRLRAPLGSPALSALKVVTTVTPFMVVPQSAVLRDASQATLAVASSYANGFTFVLGSPYAVPAAGAVLRVSAQADTATQGTLGLTILDDSDVQAVNATVSLSTVPSGRDVAYVGAVPPTLSIDGAFGDWPSPIVDPTGEASTGGNPDIDLSAHDAIRAGNGVGVYARVVGRMLRGGLVPVKNPENQATPPPTYNGTVQRPVTRGEDTIRVFIDSDKNASTGYATSVGADWMVEITGRHGVPRVGTLQRFTGANPGIWSWTPDGRLDLVVGSSQLELLATLTSAPVAGTQIVIDLRDWKGGFDSSQVRTRGMTRSATGTSVDAGVYSADLPADLWDSAGVRIKTDTFTAAWRLTDIATTKSNDTVSLSMSGGSLVTAGSSAAYDVRVGEAPATLRYTFGSGALKEELVLLAPPADPAGFDSFRLRYSLNLSKGAALLPLSDSPVARAFGDSGDIAIIVGGKSAARFPAPFAMDAGSRITRCAYETPDKGLLDIACPSSTLRDARFPVTIDPSTTFTLTNNGAYNWSGETLGWSVAAGDFNGDGYLDVLAGAPLNSKDGANFGMAYIFFGPFTSGSSIPNVNLKGNLTAQYKAGFGVGAGDFNNDGKDDAVVGQQNGGPTLLFYGRSSWPATVSTANVTFQAPSPTGTDSFGRVIAAGNFDGAGGADIVIGRPFYPGPLTPNGRAYVWFSPFAAYEPTPDLTLAPFNDTKGRFGWSLATGRIDSDAKDDIIVGEIAVTAGANTYGRISLFKGSSLTGSGTKTPDKTIIHTVAGSQFGSSVSVGLLNADSYADVLVGAPALSGYNGAAYIFLAKADGTGLDTNQSASVTIPSQGSAQRFGSAVLIGDYFNDGTKDAIVGAEGNDTIQGHVYIFNNPLVDQVVDETLSGQASGATYEEFGHVLAGGKKANDARFILVIGGPYWDDIGETDSGRAVVASIAEFSDVAIVAGTTVLVLLVVRRRRGRRE